jgi:hypothetical protein
MTTGLAERDVGRPPATPENQSGSPVDERDRERLLLAMKIHFRPLPKNGRVRDDCAQSLRAADDGDDAEKKEVA